MSDRNQILADELCQQVTLETRHDVVEVKSGDVPVLVLVVLAERLKRVDVMKILRHNIETFRLFETFAQDCFDRPTSVFSPAPAGVWVAAAPIPFLPVFVLYCCCKEYL